MSVKIPKRLVRSALTGMTLGAILAVLGLIRSVHDTPPSEPHPSAGIMALAGGGVGVVAGIAHYLTRSWRTRNRVWFRRSWMLSVTIGVGVLMVPALFTGEGPIWLDFLLWIVIGTSCGYGLGRVAQPFFFPPGSK